MVKTPPSDNASRGVAQPRVVWTEDDRSCSALWRSERGLRPPQRVAVVDDQLSADRAYRLACEGTALLWRGDYHNAKQLLSALGRRCDQSMRGKRRRRLRAGGATPGPANDDAAVFHRYRQGQAQRARILGCLLVVLDGDYRIALRRAPDVRPACLEAWGPPAAGGGDSVVALGELLGVIGAHEWRKKGVPVAALGDAPGDRIHPHYGVFSPVRDEYIDLVAAAPLPSPRGGELVAFDIGTGTGVLAALLARRGVRRIVATETSPRALACARDNVRRLALSEQVEVVEAELFPTGQAGLVVCNPPWLPARPVTALEHAVYDEGGRMLEGFLAGLAAHLTAAGEGWLILSDLAEHLGLRSRRDLLSSIAAAGLTVVDRHDTKPKHGKALDTDDPLHAARSAEVTSLWRLRGRA